MLLSLEDARANGFKADMSEKAPPPLQPGLHSFADWDLADLREPASTGRRSSAPGSWPATIPRSSTTRWSARARASLYADAQAMLDTDRRGKVADRQGRLRVLALRA